MRSGGARCFARAAPARFAVRPLSWSPAAASAQEANLLDMRNAGVAVSSTQDWTISLALKAVTPGALGTLVGVGLAQGVNVAGAGVNQAVAGLASLFSGGGTPVKDGGKGAADGAGGRGGGTGSTPEKRGRDSSDGQGGEGRGGGAAPSRAPSSHQHSTGGAAAAAGGASS